MGESARRCLAEFRKGAKVTTEVLTTYTAKPLLQKGTLCALCLCGLSLAEAQSNNFSLRSWRLGGSTPKNSQSEIYNLLLTECRFPEQIVSTFSKNVLVGGGMYFATLEVVLI
jgi:hypothetical protein